MTKRRIKVTEFTCDDCGGVVLQADDTDPVDGYRGAVSQVSRMGGTGAEWFCHLDCDPGKAIHNALVRSLENE